MPVVQAGNCFEQNTAFTCREAEEAMTIAITIWTDTDAMDKKF